MISQTEVDILVDAYGVADLLAAIHRTLIHQADIERGFDKEKYYLRQARIVSNAYDRLTGEGKLS